MDSYTDDATYLSEFRTRKQYIDPTLKNRGWLPKYIKEEVNSAKSNFKDKNIVFFDGNLQRGADRFIDYLLLDQNNNPLAIIEAKRFSKNPENGRIQARSYAADIEKQIQHKIPIFLTNGECWVFIDEYGVERKVSGPFNQEDLKRRRDLYTNREDPTFLEVNKRIVDRPRSVQIVGKLSEHFAECHRRALITMATGTGKTRVAMALIELLIQANLVRNVLFVADRISLVNQTKSSGFKHFFNEPVADLRDGMDTTSRLYVSTVQTLMSGKDERFFERFSPGFFDLVVFDEAHRSIYDRNNLLYQYFDAIKIGLTATPMERETQSTFDLFGKSIAEYSYDDAVRDGVLVPYRAHIIGTKVLGAGINREDLNKFMEDQLRRQQVDPNDFDVTGSQFDSIFMDDETNALIITEFMRNCYKSDEGKPTKSIFFCASQHHAQHVKNIFGELFPKLSQEVQVITSNMHRAEDEVHRFGKDSNPRIALSVGMLDTGVDIPEICNLVFIRPIFSSIRFWQMLGRGTRNKEACKHQNWLPGGEKKDFLIFDFTVGGHSNIKYHNLPKNVGEQKTDVTTRIFHNRVALLEADLNDEQKKIIAGKIMATLDELDPNFFLVREKQKVIGKIQKDELNLDRHVGELMDEVAPLMITQQGQNSQISSFILKTEQLYSCILDRDRERITKLRKQIQHMVENVSRKDNLHEVSRRKDYLIRVLKMEFWEDLTFQDVDFMVTEIAPLMKYFEPEPREPVDIGALDKIITWEEMEKEIMEDVELKNFLERNPIAKKIKEGECITSHELLELERELSSLKPEITIHNVQKYHNVDFIKFLWNIIGLTRQEDPKVLIEERFGKYILESSNYNSRQLNSSYY